MYLSRLSVVLTLLFVALVSACGDDDDAGQTPDPPTQDRPKVVATTVQIEALTREVGGNLIELDGLVPAGADAHEFEPVASDLTSIEEADLVLRHGIGLDEWLDDTIGAADDARVVTVTEGIALAQGEEDGETVDDPHVWHDPDNAMIMVTHIAEALVSVDPESAETYRANAAAYNQVLVETKAEVQSIIDEIPEEDRKLVTDHDAFGYFARAFGLEVVGAVFPTTATDAEPSAQDTAELLDAIEREGVKAIFSETSVSAKLSETLASDAGIAIIDELYSDSLGEEGSGAETVHGMLLTNARTIADALKGP
jgi:ABC-type Zn uptake system ZnuABC Zn-binding protein ZnuA